MSLTAPGFLLDIARNPWLAGELLLVGLGGEGNTLKLYER